MVRPLPSNLLYVEQPSPQFAILLRRHFALAIRNPIQESDLVGGDAQSSVRRAVVYFRFFFFGTLCGGCSIE